MATRHSAGLLPFRLSGAEVEVLLGHMGGPYWANRDAGAWTVIKGEHGADEEPAAAARREFEEELGLPAPRAKLLALGQVRQSGGKTVTVWACHADIDPDRITPGTFELEWPPKSGRVQQFPEIDHVRWFELPAAYEKILTGQRPFLDRLRTLVGNPATGGVPSMADGAEGDAPGGT